MSMKVLTVLQCIQIFAMYMLAAVILPAWVFRRKLSGFSLSVRLLFYYVAGNFFIVNLVLLLQLCHISNRLTLFLFTVLAAIALSVKYNGLQPLRQMKQLWKSAERILDGRIGVRTLLLRQRRYVRQKAARWSGIAGRFARSHWLELLFLTGVTGLFLWRFGYQLLHTYGFCASDIIVHHYWINALGEGNLFVAGVYPQGFHCVIYYLHEISGIDTYVFLRVFWLIQTWMVFCSLLIFLKECCRNRYLPYLGMLVYLLGTLGVLGGSTYLRFFSSLPQEFGMIFVLPSIQFLFAFFRIRKEELERADSGSNGGRRSQWCLAGFAMSFSLTLAVHFYNTMAVGLICIGGILGYGFRLFRKKYLSRVIAAGLIGVLAAVLPMAAALAMGKPLEGSLRWGMSVLKESSEEEQTETEMLQPSTSWEPAENASQELIAPSQAQTSSEVGSREGSAEASGQSTVDLGSKMENVIKAVPRKAKALFDDVISLINRVNRVVRARLTAYLLDSAYQKYAGYLMAVLYLLPCLGTVVWLAGDKDYGARMISVGTGLWLLSILMAADTLRLPTLMDSSRASIYTALVLLAAAVLLVDGLLYAVTCWIRVNTVRQMIAMPLLVTVVWMSFEMGLFSRVHNTGAFETNEAVTCLTNILRDYKDKTWTICSANDELRMADDHGYHYELTHFLGAMEYLRADTKVQIPTQYVFFFIEKIPIDYYLVGYEGSGQSISAAGAEQPLPMGSGLEPYQNENRWVMMSRMYYWMQAFRQMYPNECKVYFENENFVCYLVEQNPYALYNFAIDYGYNGRR